jgi:hypothetical protein
VPQRIVENRSAGPGGGGYLVQSRTARLVGERQQEWLSRVRGADGPVNGGLEPLIFVPRADRITASGDIGAEVGADEVIFRHGKYLQCCAPHKSGTLR